MVFQCLKVARNQLCSFCFMILALMTRVRVTARPPHSTESLIDILQNSCSPQSSLLAGPDYISPTKLLLRQHFLQSNISVIWVSLWVRTKQNSPGGNLLFKSIRREREERDTLQLRSHQRGPSSLQGL